MLQEHIKNLRNEIEEYRNSEEEEVIIPQIEVDRKGGPKNKEVDQKQGKPSCISYRKMRVSLQEIWLTS